MKPQDDYRNGDMAGGEAGGGGRSRSGSASSSSSSSGSELELVDEAAPARALATLNALRRARQHYDVLLLAGGAEVPAHRAVLAAAAPRLLPPETEGGAALVEADGAALAALVDWAYTGRLRARRDTAAAVYRAAAALRLDQLRRPLAERLLAAVAPHDALKLRALPALDADLLRRLDTYIAEHFDEICESGALAALPALTIELMRESSADDGAESAAAVAHAALGWLRGRDLDELCARTPLLFVDARGQLRGSGEAAAPAASGDDWAVLAARALSGGGARALLVLGGRLAAARVCWRDGAPGAAEVARGAALGGGGGGGCGAGERLQPMAAARCALGAAALAGRLLVCGGYDRAQVLRSAEAYEPASNSWTPLASMRGARARFPAAAVGGALLALGGSDGQADLAAVEALQDGSWRAGPALPLARAHAAAASSAGAVYVLGGLAAGQCLRRVDRYTPPSADQPARWDDAPPLLTGRSQCASVVFENELWALGGCDAWHCLASTERLLLGGQGRWAAGPPLPTARRSAGAAAWRGRLCVVGGSDGAASLRRCDWLPTADAADWRPGPELRRPRAAHALAVLGDALYAVGGFDGKHFLACVEALHQPDGCWTDLRAPPAPARPLPATDSEPLPDRNGEPLPCCNSEPLPGCDSEPLPGRGSEPLPSAEP